MRNQFLRGLFSLSMVAVFAVLAGVSLPMREAQAAPNSGQYTVQEIIDAGHSFFGSTSGGLAKVVENAFDRYGLPNGYILGQEGSGAFIAGLTYGEGQLNTKNAGEHPLYWQGPSLGLDYGGQGTRVMMLVYNLANTDAIFTRFGGISGQAFVIAGFGMTALKNNNIVVVPIRTGIGARLGLNLGYLKITPDATWNPF
ncbi:MAG: EipA family protein [Rhizobium sp.]